MPNRKQIRRATRQREIAFELEIERPGPDGREWMEVEIHARGNAGHYERDPQEDIDAEIEILTVRAQDPNGKPIARYPWQRPFIPYDVPIELTADEMAQAEEMGLERLALEASEDDDGPDRYDD